MAAYAALVSLSTILDQIHDHPRLFITLKTNQIQFLKETVDFLLDFLESGPLHRSCEEAAHVLETQITSAAYAAEDVIETHVVDQIQAGSASLLDLETVIQDMDCVKEKVVTFEEKIKDLKPKYYPIISASTSSSETPLTTTGKSTMVGFDRELYQLKDALTAHRSALQIIPIVGMGGIGKTTLAKNVYEDPLILQHFDIRGWATISQEYSLKDIFSKLLSRESKSAPETGYHQLGQELYQRLIGRRYLIVLDDMWSSEVWYKIKNFFPDKDNGSRVVVTTRLSSMATCFGTWLLPLKLLDEDNSWKLFRETAFPREEGCCPSELEEFGKKIVKKCEGLPLLIVVLGSLLRKSSRTQEYWEDISHDINSILNSGEEEIKNLDILRLSYRHLPAHLKPCFLYMGIFPEDDVIRASRLIKLWVAEGFVKSNKTQSLEEVGEGYLKDLVGRNLLVLRANRYGKKKTCQMHDLLRELCLKIAEKENFLGVIKANDIRQQGVVDKGPRRIAFQQETSLEQTTSGFDGLEPASPLTRSLVSNANLQSTKFKLLRVLNTPNSYYNIGDILKQVNLRHVCICLHPESPSGDHLSSLPLLWNLQTLIIQGEAKFVAPPEIWEMRQLRHVNFYRICLPDPPLSRNEDEVVVLRNLKSLETTSNLRISAEVCKRIPNVKKLRTVYEDLPAGSLSYDFGRLHELELLKCWFLNQKPTRDDLLRSLTFPRFLEKLILRGCRLHWEDLRVVGSLPHLQVLQLEQHAVTGPYWNPVEGEFLSLKFLTISYCGDLINWNADKSCFPVLEILVLDGLQGLKEIPWGIGEIPTLGFIELVGCTVSAAISAMGILEERQSLGNEDDLQVRIDFLTNMQLRSFKKEVQHMECFTSTNLQFRCIWS